MYIPDTYSVYIVSIYLYTIYRIDAYSVRIVYLHVLREIAIALNKELSDEQAKEQLEEEAKRREKLFEEEGKMNSQGLLAEVTNLEENPNDANNPFKQCRNLGKAYQLTG